MFSLDAAISDLYSAFARPAPGVIEGCAHCTDPIELAALLQAPLRQLTAEQLTSYAFDALLTAGSTDDLRYLWPRLLELLVSGELAVDAEIVLAKLRHGDWQAWPAPERAAIQTFETALGKSFGTVDYPEYRVEEWVCAIGQYRDDVAPMLEHLLTETPAATRNLLSYYDLNHPEALAGELFSAFWNERTTPKESAIRWILSERVATAVSAARERVAG